MGKEIEHFLVSICRHSIYNNVARVLYFSVSVTRYIVNNSIYVYNCIDVKPLNS